MHFWAKLRKCAKLSRDLQLWGRNRSQVISHKTKASAYTITARDQRCNILLRRCNLISMPTGLHANELLLFQLFHHLHADALETRKRRDAHLTIVLYLSITVNRSTRTSCEQKGGKSD